MKATILIAVAFLFGCASAQPTGVGEARGFTVENCRTDMECMWAAMEAGWPEEDMP
jgi:hypothetical protein